MKQNNKAKRTLAAVSAMTIVCGSLVACTSAKPQETEAPKATETVKATEVSKAEAVVEGTESTEYVPAYPIVDEKITVTGLVVGADTSVSDSRIVWDKVEEITGIDIEWINIDQEALSTYLAGGEWPDFFHCQLDAGTVNDYGVIGGRFVNYLEYLDVMPNLVKTFEDYPLTLAASTQLNGEIYNLFQVAGGTSTSTVTRPHVKMDVLNAAGITELPTTVDELYDQLVVLKEKNGQPGLLLDTGTTTGIVPMLFAAFGTQTILGFDDDGAGNVIYTRTSEQMKHYYEYLNKLYEEGLMNQEWLTLDNTAKNQLVKSGIIAYPTQAAAQSLAEEDLGGNWDNLGCLAPLTSEYADDQVLSGVIDYRTVGGMYINKDSSYVEEICKMLDICFAEEEVVPGSGLIGTAFTMGLEGVDYIVNEDGTYEQIVPENFEGAFTTYQNQLLRWQDIGRKDRLGLAVTSTAGNAQARQKGYVANVIPYQKKDHIFPTGVLKFTDDEQYVIDNKYADIDKYVLEMEAKFISGAADIDSEWDAYVSNCEKMGINEVLEVYQAAYDRWNTALASLN